MNKDLQRSFKDRNSNEAEVYTLETYKLECKLLD
jgi:hypothetical protein